MRCHTDFFLGVETELCAFWGEAWSLPLVFSEPVDPGLRAIVACLITPGLSIVRVVDLGEESLSFLALALIGVFFAVLLLDFMLSGG